MVIVQRVYGGGGGVLPIMDYTGRLRPKAKGYLFHAGSI